MDQLSKKEIKTKVKESVAEALEKLQITKASKKTKRVIKKTAGQIAKALTREIKKIARKEKKAHHIKSVKPKKAIKAKGKSASVAETQAEEPKMAS